MNRNKRLPRTGFKDMKKENEDTTYYFLIEGKRMEVKKGILLKAGIHMTRYKRDPVFFLFKGFRRCKNGRGLR